MYLSTAVAAWLVASAPLQGEDAASAGRNIAALLAQDSGIPAPAGSSPQTTDTAKLPSKSDEIIVSGSNRAPREDPIQALNIQTYALTQAVDTAIVAPAAIGYQRAIPEPIRAGIRHFFNHITLPVVFINDLLQLHPGRAAKTLARFAINSTVGIVGLVDVAKRKGINLPYRPNGFANTLGYYGVKTGPFLFVPLIGPTTIRDLIGLVVDRLFLPNVVGKPFNQPAYAVGATLVGSIDYRAEYDVQLRKIQAEANPYAAARANYLKRRQAEIDALHGRVAPVTDDPTRVDGPPARR
jgi:phospholipid-binding lipoprotein MlaA